VLLHDRIVLAQMLIEPPQALIESAHALIELPQALIRRRTP